MSDYKSTPKSAKFFASLCLFWWSAEFLWKGMVLYSSFSAGWDDSVGWNEGSAQFVYIYCGMLFFLLALGCLQSWRLDEVSSKSDEVSDKSDEVVSGEKEKEGELLGSGSSETQSKPPKRSFVRLLEPPHL